MAGGGASFQPDSATAMRLSYHRCSHEVGLLGRPAIVCNHCGREIANGRRFPGHLGVGQAATPPDPLRTLPRLLAGPRIHAHRPQR